MDEETNSRFERIEERLNILEGHKTEVKISKSESEKNYSGLAGGIRFLITNGFFDSPKNVRDVFDELKKKGYHYSYDSADKLLRVDLVKNKTLNRFKEGKTWSYVIRK